MSSAAGPRTGGGDVLGVNVSAIAMADAIELIARWIEEGCRGGCGDATSASCRDLPVSPRARCFIAQ